MKDRSPDGQEQSIAGVCFEESNLKELKHGACLHGMAQHGRNAITLVSGDGPPRSANGELQENCEVLLWRIEVGSYEEAMAIRNLRLGYAPYVPHGESASCPVCDATYYPQGTGQCWNCEFDG